MGYIVFVLITWDEIKAETNLKKHGVSFVEAASVFFTGPVLRNLDDEPGRRKTIGFSSQARLLLVVTAEEDEDQLRIVSARKAEKYEKEEFKKRIRF